MAAALVAKETMVMADARRVVGLRRYAARARQAKGVKVDRVVVKGSTLREAAEWGRQHRRRFTPEAAVVALVRSALTFNGLDRLDYDDAKKNESRERCSFCRKSLDNLRERNPRAEVHLSASNLFDASTCRACCEQAMEVLGLPLLVVRFSENENRDYLLSG